MSLPAPDPVHAGDGPVSVWIERWGSLLPGSARVLDVACGGGRHSRWFAARGHPVTAVDRDPAVKHWCRELVGVTGVVVDLETGPWPFPGQRFGGVIVTNYLHRPLLATLVESVEPGGVLLYETFAAGNERFGRPSRPDFLLRPGELLELVRGRLRVVAFEDVQVELPRPAMVQRLAARRE